MYIYIYIGGVMEYISQKVAAYGQFVLVKIDTGDIYIELDCLVYEYKC